jgi:hypothetical protein
MLYVQWDWMLVTSLNLAVAAATAVPWAGRQEVEEEWEQKAASAGAQAAACGAARYARGM